MVYNMIVGGNSINIIGAKPYVADVDASKVIEAIRATGVQPTHAMRNYAHTICSGLKGTGMWQNSVALYGMLGGTADSHKWNWKDMRDLDVAFRLTFPNGMTHDSFGITGNGSGYYANTFFKPKTVLGNTSLSASIYSTKNTVEATNKIVMGALNVSDNSILSLGYYTSVELSLSNNAGQDYSNVPKRSDNKGYVLVSVGTGNNFSNHKELNRAMTAKFNGNLSCNDDIFLLARNQVGVPQLPSAKSLGFAHLGVGLTIQIASSSSQVITQAQSILARA